MKTPVGSLVGKSIHEIKCVDIFHGVEMPNLEFIGDEAYLEFKTLGISMVLFDGETVSAVQLHGEGHEGYSEFLGEIPSGITFQTSRDRVRDTLGKPLESGDGGRVLLLGFRPPWDAYLINGQRLHFEYKDDSESIQLVTITG